MVVALKADLHTHTYRSRHPVLASLSLVDGLDSDETMVAAAKEAGFDVYAITDHNVVYPRDRAEELSDRFGIVVVPGCELHLGLKEALLLDVDHLPEGETPAGIREEVVDDQGGLMIAQHPWDPLGRGYRDWSAFDAVEAINGLGGGATRDAHWDALEATDKPLVASSDGHWRRMLGYCWTEIDSRAGTASGVVEAIRRGDVEPKGEPLPRSVVADYYRRKYALWAKQKLAGNPLFEEHVPAPDGTTAR